MSTKYTILVLNGPNLKYLGMRQPEIYGRDGMNALPELLRNFSPEHGDKITLIFDQHNHEGGLIDRLEQAFEEKTDGIVLNAGAYSHTSLALSDSLAWIKIPTVEVHLSNVVARPEALRHHSAIGASCIGQVSGFGMHSYVLGILALYNFLERK